MAHMHGLLDAKLETRWAPLDEVERSFGLESRDCGCAITWNAVAAVKESHSHVLAVAWITDHHLVVWLKA